LNHGPARKSFMDIDRLRELAALHALGQLEGDDAIEFARLLGSGDATVQREVGAFEDVSAAIARSVPPVKPSPRVKEALLRKIAPRNPQPSPWDLLKALLPKQSQGFAFVHDVGGEGWQNLPVPGASFKLLSVDQERRYAVTLGRLAPGAHFPTHKHYGPEDIYMLSGDLHIGSEVLTAGDYHHATTGTTHPVNFSEHGCTILLILSTEDLLAQLQGA